MKKNLNRREFIKKTAAGVLGAGAIGAVTTIIPSSSDGTIGNPYPELPDRKPAMPPYNPDALFFDEHQYALVVALAELILPADEAAGATDADVVDTIDDYLARHPRDGKNYVKGLRWLDRLSKEKYQKKDGFLALEIAEQIELLCQIDEVENKKSRPVSNLFQRIDRKLDKVWDELFGLGSETRFFRILRRDVISAYYSNPISWISVGYYGPPQPVGYLDFTEPPSLINYTDSGRPVRNQSCQICHTDVRHPTGGLIDHSCKSCHKPHSPWLYDKSAFYLEDHVEFAFPSLDREKE